MKQRIFSILLSLCLAACLLAPQAFAEGSVVREAATADALTAALADTAAEEIKLTADITVGSTLNIARTVTLDLNGKVLKLDGKTNGSVIKVETAGNLTLKDSAPKTEHKFTVAESGLWTLDEAKGTKTINGGVITGGTGSQHSSTYRGGGVYNCGTFTMQGGSIAGCIAAGKDGSDSGRGGGVYNDGTFRMEGGSIVGCVDLMVEGCGTSGGAGVYSRGSFTMTGGTIAECAADQNGGGIFGMDGSTVMTGGTISDCSAKYSGGAVYLWQASFEMSGNAEIKNCSAKGMGGGVLTSDNGCLTMSGKASIHGCTAPKGAGIALRGDLVSGAGVMYADGGTVEDTVYIAYGELLQDADATADTQFVGAVKMEAALSSGGRANAKLEAGIFRGSVTCTYGNIRGGLFYGTLTAEGNGMIDGLTVTYEVDGERYAVQVLQSGERAAAPEAPKKAGQALESWYLNNGVYDFDSAVTENLILTAHWMACDHSGNTNPTNCAEETVCSVCGGTIAPTGAHSFLWKRDDHKYWKKCENCGFETEKKDIPTVTIAGADRVCRTQDYVFTFALPEGCTGYAGYEFPMVGSNVALSEKNGVYTATVEASWYDKNEDAFDVVVSCETEDGYYIFFLARKHVTILNAHTGGEAACTAKAKCEVCGEAYGEIDAKNHVGLTHVPAKVATKKAEGNIAYWFCKDCGKYFADESATREIAKADTVLPKLADAPKTGDESGLMGWSALLLLCGAAAVCCAVARKRTEK